MKPRKNITNNITNKLIHLFLVIVLLICIIPISAEPAEAASSDRAVSPFGYGDFKSYDKSKATIYWQKGSCVITSYYGKRIHPISGTYSNHGGMDLAKGEGTPVHSSLGGKVVIAEWYYGYGNTVIVQSGRYNILYGHLSKITVSKGQTVAQGQKIGEVGSTGDSTGPHLHYEIRLDDYSNPNKTIDPYPYLIEGKAFDGVSSQTYTIKYNANGGSGSMSDQKIVYGVSTQLTANGFTKKGHHFVGWAAKRNDGPDAGKYYYISTDGSAKGWYEQCPSGWIYNLYVNKETVSKTTTAGRSVTMYAQWEPNTFWVTYKANGGEGEMARQKFTYGVSTPTTPNAFTKKGHIFEGWEVTVINEKGDGKTEGRYVNPDGSQSGWYVVGKQPSGWDYYLYPNGGSISATTYKDNGECVFTARWKPITYIATYRANGGTGTMADQTFVYGKKNQPMNKNQFVREGYEFKGWECIVLDENNDGKDWGRYQSPDKSENKWYVVGEQPEGWTFHLYGDQAIISSTTYKDQGVCVFTAHWEKIAGEQGIPGDVNMDGEVDIRDVTRLLRYIKYRNKEVDEKAIDVNGDGELDIRDVTRLLRYSKYRNKEIYYDGVKYDPTA